MNQSASDPLYTDPYVDIDDFEGTGEYPVSEPFDGMAPSERATVKTRYAFAKPGTYFPALRASSHRLGDTKTRYARVHNLGRVRVVVRESNP